ncbi:hypothetical protein MTR_4g012675 [Medicago truncatula]|uniref:Uncharacterized protein n=1 Tax=Medicago truncatula TaxID=3880 RepID=A0A072UGB6_MEDTR|nr:hypothetical protein MTR_4g012675 [Medicago truncatula]
MATKHLSPHQEIIVVSASGDDSASDENLASDELLLLTTSSLQLQKHFSFRLMRTNIGWIESWSKRKGFGADSVQKYEDSRQKYVSLKVRMLARPVLEPPSRAPFAAFAWILSYSILAHNLSWNILRIYLLIF